MNTKLSSIILILLLFVLPLTVSTTSPISLNEVIKKPIIESDTPTEGVIGQVKVSDDIGVVNGSYQDTNLDIYDQLYIGTAYDTEWLLGRSWFKFNLSEVNFLYYKAVMCVYNLKMNP